MSSNDFVPVNEKLKRLIPDPVELNAYNHFCTIIERMIRKYQDKLPVLHEKIAVLENKQDSIYT